MIQRVFYNDIEIHLMMKLFIKKTLLNGFERQLKIYALFDNFIYYLM